MIFQMIFFLEWASRESHSGKNGVSFIKIGKAIAKIEQFFGAGSKCFSAAFSKRKLLVLNANSKTYKMAGVSCFKREI